MFLSDSFILCCQRYVFSEHKTSTSEYCLLHQTRRIEKILLFLFSTYKVSAVDESFLNEVAEVTITKLGSTSSYNDWMKFTELWTKVKTEFLTPKISEIPRQNTVSFKPLLTIVFLSWKSHYWDSFFYCKTWIMPGLEPCTYG